MAEVKLPEWFDIDDAQARLAEGWSPPTTWYHDAGIHRFEQEMIFRRRWQYGAPRQQLHRPGDVVVTDAGGVPVVLTCDATGQVRGFVNMCRHRGYAVATECGHRRLLTCRYHGWSYDLDGKLVAAPGCKDDAGFRQQEMGLIPVAVDSWGPIVFVNADPQARPLREAHPKLEEILTYREFDPDPANYELYKRYVYDIESNWKLWYDNAVECYHCPTIHSGTFNTAYETGHGKVDAIEVDGLLSQRFQPAKGAVSDNSYRSSNYRGLEMFPGFIFIQQDDIMMIAQMAPVGPEKTKFVVDMFGQKSSDPERVAGWCDIWDKTFQEDAAAVEIQQTGLRTNRMPRSRFLPGREKSVLFMNHLILQEYRDGMVQ